jgi:hypothetical protein
VDDNEARAACAAIVAALQHQVLEHVGPILRFLAERNERAAMVSFGSAAEGWLCLMVTRELVDQVLGYCDEMQTSLRAASKAAGVRALDERQRADGSPPPKPPKRDN